MTSTIKLQSPDYDNDTKGSELLLPVVSDRHAGSSLAAIITLFDGKNETLDFRQLREVITLQGVITPLTAKEAGFTNTAGDGVPLYMRDEIRRIRGASERGSFGGTPGSPESWLSEPITNTDWGTGTLPSGEQDSNTTRKKGRIRLIYDKAWDSSGNDFQNLFLYGTVGDFTFGPRAGASFRNRIPYTLTFLVGSVRVA